MMWGYTIISSKTISDDYVGLYDHIIENENYMWL